MAATESNPLVLYDIASKLEPRTWSGNVWKTRLLLNHKHIPYRTEWISYPDIEPTFKKMGMKPGDKTPDGSPLYTCPSIIDPTSPEPTLVSDSFVIAQYLDEAYSDTSKYGPKLLPEETKEAQLAFVKLVDRGASGRIAALMLPLMPAVLEDPRGVEFFKRTKTERRGQPIEELAVPSIRAASWAALNHELDQLARIYDENQAGNGDIFTGEDVTYADMALAAELFWTKFVPSTADGEAKSVWDLIKGLHGGKWARLLEKFEGDLEIK